MKSSVWEPRPSNSVARASIPKSEGGGSQTVGANQKIQTRAELDYFLTYHPIGNDYIKLVTGTTASARTRRRTRSSSGRPTSGASTPTSFVPRW